jgi:hypothetical protein
MHGSLEEDPDSQENQRGDDYCQKDCGKRNLPVFRMCFLLSHVEYEQETMTESCHGTPEIRVFACSDSRVLPMKATQPPTPESKREIPLW